MFVTSQFGTLFVVFTQMLENLVLSMVSYIPLKHLIYFLIAQVIMPEILAQHLKILNLYISKLYTSTHHFTSGKCTKFEAICATSELLNFGKIPSVQHYLLSQKFQIFRIGNYGRTIVKKRFSFQSTDFNFKASYFSGKGQYFSSSLIVIKSKFIALTLSVDTTYSSFCIPQVK